jgi:hypothetical protein
LETETQLLRFAIASTLHSIISSRYTRVTAVECSQVTVSGFVSSPLFSHMYTSSRGHYILLYGHRSEWLQAILLCHHILIFVDFFFFSPCDHPCFCQLHTGGAGISCQMGGWNLEGLFLAMSVDWYEAWLRVIWMCRIGNCILFFFLFVFLLAF